ncbi:FKBP-type peptidyl-prolyl cis-trans isomerase [Kangiella sediminilitoris]|uniref:peptidylprolyl isomerase n=1 Tax=Kangiella sediminilitoris TaxID=1144748 RepID=A0A1B3B886_9GAMM|nr:FKBP-type peptidyl-prolyl cis-trans isomerase [Kangiella sediminilitoris]AOE49007.1 Peptidyl-prolyl cis-trans isomerase [Kangiella sediminilitoris]
MTHISIKKTAVALALTGVLVACDSGNDKVANSASEEQPVAAGENQTVEFKDQYEKAAYAMGVNFSTQMTKNFDSLKEYDIEINKDLVVQGMRDGFAGDAKMSEEEVMANINEFQTALNEKMKERQAELAAEAKERAEENLKAGQAFQADYAEKDGVTKTESGLLYRAITEVEGGESPTAEDAVRVHYRGTFIDGEEFDSSYKRNQPIDFNLNGVIPGWTEGLQYMTVGDKYEFVIPADLAYGENDRGNIPGNSTLVFEVELLAVNPTEPYVAPEETIEEQAEEAVETIDEAAEEAGDVVKETAEEAKQIAEETAEELKQDVKGTALEDSVEESKQKSLDAIETTAEDAGDAVEKTAEDAKNEVNGDNQ